MGRHRQGRQHRLPQRFPLGQDRLPRQEPAQRLVEAVQSALKEDVQLLSTLERAHIDNCLSRLQSVLVGDDRRAIDAAMDALSKGTAEFAARRMNQSVRRALTGKKMDEVSL